MSLRLCFFEATSQSGLSPPLPLLLHLEPEHTICIVHGSRDFLEVQGNM